MTETDRGEPALTSHKVNLLKVKKKELRILWMTVMPIVVGALGPFFIPPASSTPFPMLKELGIKGIIRTIQMTVLLKRVKMLRRMMEH